MYFIVFSISYVFPCFSTLNFVLFFGGKLLLIILQSQIHQNEINLISLSVNNRIYVNFLKKCNLHWICTQNHVFEQILGQHIFFKWAWLQNRVRERGEFGLKSCAIS